jgi:hypothetical protein
MAEAQGPQVGAAQSAGIDLQQNSLIGTLRDGDIRDAEIHRRFNDNGFHNLFHISVSSNLQTLPAFSSFEYIITICRFAIAIFRSKITICFASHVLEAEFCVTNYKGFSMNLPITLFCHSREGGNPFLFFRQSVVDSALFYYNRYYNVCRTKL